MSELTIREIDYTTVEPLRHAAARDGVALGPTRNTRWWGAYRGDHLCGVAGLIAIAGVYRVKGVFVPRVLRGEGIGTQLTEAVIAAAPADRPVEVFAYNPAFYQGRGFDLAREVRKGVTRLVWKR